MSNISSLSGLVHNYAESQGWVVIDPYNNKWRHPFIDDCVVYISGPMSGITNFNREAFWLAEMAINLAGVETKSPAHWCSGLPYEYYMKEDFKLLLQCNAIFILKGWANSPGAMIEVQMAKSLGYKMFYEV